jgi:putative ABC transport system permease protein
MINRLVIQNLRHRPIRTALSVMAIALEVSMILLIVGLSEGLLEESARRTRGVGADIMIRPSTSSAAMALSTADIPEKLLEKLPETFPEIAVATGTTLSLQGGLQSITGVRWDDLVKMSGGIRYLAGGAAQGPYDAIVDEVYARSQNLKVGDKAKLLNQDFRVSGIVESGKMSRIFVPLETMQDLMGWHGKLSLIYLKLKDPKQTDEMIKKLSQMLPSYPVWSVEDFLSQAATDIRAMSSQFVNVIIGIAVVIGFIVVLLSMYTAILERTREIGILKSLGASKSYIVGMIMRETLLVCAAGIVVGFAFSYVGKGLVESQFPLITIILFPSWLVWGSIIAVVGATLGAFYPAARAAYQDPIEALSYE